MSTRVKGLIAGTFALVVVGYIGVIVYLKSQETSLVYQPVNPKYGGGRVDAPPDSLHVEQVSFPSADGTRLTAWVVPPAGTDTTGLWVLINHGNAGNITLPQRQDFYARLRQLGVGILAYDYRSFGASESRPLTESGLYSDAQGAYDYLRKVRGIPANRIVIFGHSLGSGVAVQLATHVEAAGLIVEGAYTGVDLVAAERYPLLPVRAIMANHFDSIDRIDSVSMPKLFLHASDDRVIPFAQGRALAAKAKEPKQFVELTGGHEDAYRLDPRYLQSFGTFVRQLAPSGGPAGESPSPPKAVH
jgi:fermentation-respiration switch protein FrsA (DUF1100 family)